MPLSSDSGIFSFQSLALRSTAWRTKLIAGTLRGRKCTCYPGIRDDLINAGGLYENAEVVVDGTLVTSRRPEDLPALMREFVALLEKNDNRSIF